MVPEFLKIVIGAHPWLHYVHYDVAQIDQYPFPRVLAFHAAYAGAGLFRLFLHVAGESFGLAGGMGAGDDHAIELRGEVRDVENRDIHGLDILESGDDCFLQFAYVHQRQCVPFE
jgi:hypothetical protein